MRLCLAYPGNPRFYIEGESPRLCRGTYSLHPDRNHRHHAKSALDAGAPSTHDHRPGYFSLTQAIVTVRDCKTPTPGGSSWGVACLGKRAPESP